MKRTLLRSSVLVLVVLAAALGVMAQTSQQYRADIPFSFEANGRQHSAGSYRVGSVSMSRSGPIGLVSVKSGNMGLLGGYAQPGNHEWDNRGTLTFLQANGKYVLKEISTPTFKLKLKAKRAQIRDDRLAYVEPVIKVYLN